MDSVANFISIRPSSAGGDAGPRGSMTTRSTTDSNGGSTPFTEDILETLTFLLGEIGYCVWKFEDDLPLLLKSLKYLFVFNKSMLKSHAVPHQWPSFLAHIHWLVQIASFDPSKSTSKTSCPSSRPGLSTKIGYRVSKLDDDLAPLLKSLKYLFVFKKFMLKSPAVPHQWPSFLALIHWLVLIASFDPFKSTSNTVLTLVQARLVHQYILNSYLNYIKGHYDVIGYRVSKLDDDLAPLLKSLKYLFVFNKFMLKSPAVPHQWPSFLALIHWLILIASFDPFKSTSNTVLSLIQARSAQQYILNSYLNYIKGHDDVVEELELDFMDKLNHQKSLT
ncbi:hypothetical protein Ahy_A06g026244 [Arachis hypogaea]|uniref:Kinetochore protein NDC80 n=1 Tax=Arachis hypogaea TaxID=3818 RepID=A0A445CJW4_ARAHY|nr:hypothetical protein Ahy_A06g026244 [Arachis hypogaea]